MASRVGHRRNGPASGLVILAALAAVAGSPPSPTTTPAPTAARTTPPAPDVPLFPGQTVQPIDLASALRMACSRDLDIATVRQQVMQSLADLQEARGLWLPSLFTGPTYTRLDGQVQAINGHVESVSRGAFSMSSTATLANSFPAAPPGSGYPPLNSLSGVLRLSDAIYQPLAAKRVVAANRAGVRAATNDALLAASEGYFDLQLAAGTLAIAREAAGNAGALADITGTFARTGEGLEADHRRILTELRGRRRGVRAAAGQLKVASAELIRRLVLDPHLVVAPVEPAETVLRLVPDDVPIDELIHRGWMARPELARSRELVQAAEFRLKQARLRPFVPSVAIAYVGSGFGGGQNNNFNNFNLRGDLAASLFWDLRGMGVIDLAVARRQAASKKIADIDLVRVQAQVARDVVAASEARAAAEGQMEEARDSVAEAVESLELNLNHIRRGAGLPGATRPIEVLQPIQALAQSRTEYLAAVLAYNRAQFRLLHAIGRPSLITPGPGSPDVDGAATRGTDR